MMVYISNEKTTCFGLWRPSSGFDEFLAIRILYITARKMSKPEDGRYRPKHVVFTLLSILYKTLLARKLSKPEDGRYRPKHVVFPLLVNTII